MGANVIHRLWREPLRRLLNNPILFYAARFLLVGDQRTTKRLLRHHLSSVSDERVLDVCCGIGEFATIVDSVYVGVDLNVKFIERARHAYHGTDRKTFEVCNAIRLHFPEKHFDKAIIVNALHHFSDEEALCLLSEMRRVTRRLVIIVDADGTRRGIMRRMLLAMDRGRFMRTPEDLSTLIGRIFKIEECIRFRVGLYSELLFRCPVDAES